MPRSGAIVAAATRISAVGGRKAAKRQGFNLVCGSYCLCALIRGLQNLESSRRERVYSFCFCKKNQKAAGTSSCDLGSKLYRIISFVILPAFVPKPVCVATHLFGCFEPVRKGCCSADARLIFFGNRLLYCKLTEASHIRKGQLHVIFVAAEIGFFGVLIESYALN